MKYLNLKYKMKFQAVYSFRIRDLQSDHFYKPVNNLNHREKKKLMLKF